MRGRYPIAAALTSAILGVAGCGGSGSGNHAVNPGAAGGSGPAAAAATRPEPPQGVPAGTNPLPLPRKGQAYNNPQPRSNIRDGGTLTLPIGGLGPNFNLFSAQSTEDVQGIMRWVAPSLWNYTVTGEVSPNPDYLLSAKLINDDPETVEYTLNPKAKWNDGTPIDWTAFAATWKTQSGNDKRFNPLGTDGYSSIGSVKKGKKNNQVVVTFKKPFYPYQLLFANIENPKNLDPKFYKTGWVDNLHPELLAGPFTVASLTDERLVLKRNPKWWGKPPKLDRVVYRQMGDSASINAFQNGEIDATGVGTADRLKQISDMKNVQVRRGFLTATTVYVMTRSSALFKEAAARKAFVLGTNRRLLAKINFEGMHWSEQPPGSELMFPWQDGYQDNIPDLHYDPAEARKILDQAGWTMGSDGYRHKNGKIAEFRYVTFGDDPTIAALARAQQKMASDIGLKMDIDTLKVSDFAQTVSNHDFDIIIMEWVANDPFGYASSICQLYCSDSQSNYTGLGNKELDKLLEKPGTIENRARAIMAANAAESKALHLYGTLPLFNGPSDVAVKKGLANFGPAGFLVPPAEDVGWEKGAH